MLVLWCMILLKRTTLPNTPVYLRLIVQNLFPPISQNWQRSLTTFFSSTHDLMPSWWSFEQHGDCANGCKALIVEWLLWLGWKDVNILWCLVTQWWPKVISDWLIFILWPFEKYCIKLNLLRLDLTGFWWLDRLVCKSTSMVCYWFINFPVVTFSESFQAGSVWFSCHSALHRGPNPAAGILLDSFEHGYLCTEWPLPVKMILWELLLLCGWQLWDRYIAPNWLDWPRTLLGLAFLQNWTAWYDVHQFSYSRHHIC